MNQISQAARAFRQRAEDEARFLETCDGGDPGAPDQPSIWVLGIEPGWSKADDVAERRGVTDEEKDNEEARKYSINRQLKWRYNCAAFQLLAALNGTPVRDYRLFAEQARPFEQGSIGYFKGNLFPEPFNDVGSWDNEAAYRTGFADKDDYRV